MADKKINIYCDGGSRGNPGPSAAGIVFTDSDNKVIYKDNKYLGIQTNNFAEYSAVLLALDKIGTKYHDYKITFYLDSQLVVRQLSGQYKVKSSNIIPLHQAIVSKIKDRDIEFNHVLRQYNKLADEQVNICLDSHAID